MNKHRTANPAGPHGPTVAPLRSQARDSAGAHDHAAVATTVTTATSATAHRARPSASPDRESAADSAGGIILKAVGLKKAYHKGKHEVPVLRGVDLEVRQGELMAVIGQSGSGKSTLLHLLATLDRPDEGEIWFNGQRIDNASTRQRDRLRNRQLGMIFQFYHLLPELTALENVLAPLMITHGYFSYRLQRRKLVERAKSLLETVGLAHRLKHRPRELSGGEMQRAAIARALITEPQILLADEPTGNLDGRTGQGIMELLRSLNTQSNLTIVMVTHDSAIASQADRVVQLVDGQVSDS